MTAHQLIGVLATIALAGCIAPAEFDPVGSIATMQGSWTIDGAPPTPESCEAAEVRFVRVRFFEADTHRDHPGLVFDCALGAFDTRPDHLVADGQWDVAPIAIRADGSEVARGASQTVDTNVADAHVILVPFDFAGGSG